MERFYKSALETVTCDNAVYIKALKLYICFSSTMLNF